MTKLTYLVAAILFLGVQTASAETYTADVWADNWFSLSVNGTQVAEDRVSITTERSFNAESFSFTAEPPFVLGLVAKDFKENDTGLEYIGSRRQQMGDGGVILQIKDSSGDTVAVTNEKWTCMVTHKAPVNKSCENEDKPVAACGFEVTEEPADWDAADFDASSWPSATQHSESAVSPKHGYDRISEYRKNNRYATC